MDGIVASLITDIPSLAKQLYGVRPAILHGDLRLENILFEELRAQYFVDWQLLAIGSPMVDTAYFLTQSGEGLALKDAEEYMLQRYEELLRPFGYTRPLLLAEYKTAILYNLIMPIFGASYDIHTLGEPRTIAISAFHRNISAYLYHH